MISDFKGADTMKKLFLWKECCDFMKRLIPFLDDILVLFGLVSFIVASYLVNAVLGTYVLGIAFFIAAIFAGVALRNPIIQQFISKFQKRK